jgi:hypothetical protein
LGGLANPGDCAKTRHWRGVVDAYMVKTGFACRVDVAMPET